MDVWPHRHAPGWLDSVSPVPYDSQPFSEHRFSFWAFLGQRVAPHGIRNYWETDFWLSVKKK